MPLDAGSLAPTEGSKNGLLEGLLERLNEDQRRSFSSVQIDALREACGKLKWNQHPVDIRLSIPLLIARYYLVILGGRERRSAGRRRFERERFPLGKLGNVIFITVIGLAFLYLAVFIEAMILHAVIGGSTG
jgi:hypothetical protein